MASAPTSGGGRACWSLSNDHLVLVLLVSPMSYFYTYLGVGSTLVATSMTISPSSSSAISPPSINFPWSKRYKRYCSPEETPPRGHPGAAPPGWPLGGLGGPDL